MASCLTGFYGKSVNEQVYGLEALGSFWFHQLKIMGLLVFYSFARPYE